MPATRKSTRIRRRPKCHDPATETHPKSEPSDGVCNLSEAPQAVGNGFDKDQPAKNASGKRIRKSVTPSRVSEVHTFEDQSPRLISHEEIGKKHRKRRKVTNEASSVEISGTLEKSCTENIQEMDTMMAATQLEPTEGSRPPETEKSQSRASSITSTMSIAMLLNHDGPIEQGGVVENQTSTPEANTQTPNPASPQHEGANDLGSWLRQIKNKRKATDCVRQAESSSGNSIVAQAQTGASNSHGSQSKRSWSSTTDSTETSSGRSGRSTPTTAAMPKPVPQLATPRFIVTRPLSDTDTTNTSPLTKEQITSLVLGKTSYSNTDAPVSDSFQIPGPGEENDLYWADGSPRFVVRPRRKNPIVTNSQGRMNWRRPKQGLRPELVWRKRNGWVEKQDVQEISVQEVEDDEGTEATVTKTVITL